jgi:hypothetical protein
MGRGKIECLMDFLEITNVVPVAISVVAEENKGCVMTESVTFPITVKPKSILELTIGAPCSEHGGLGLIAIDLDGGVRRAATISRATLPPLLAQFFVAIGVSMTDVSVRDRRSDMGQQSKKGGTLSASRP